MGRTTPVIIEAAINGGTPKSVNPLVPRTPQEIAADAIACFRAGAAVVHNHVDRSGGPAAEIAEEYLEGWRPVLAEIPDALLYSTLNYVTSLEAEDFFGHLPALAASGATRIGVLDPGTINVGRYDASGIPRGKGIYRNSFDDIARAFALLDELGLGPSLAIYEPGFLRVVVEYWRAGKLPRGAMVKFYFCIDKGIFGSAYGLMPTAAGLAAYLEILGDCPVPWAVSLAGADIMTTDMPRLAIEQGGHVHVGMEAYAEPGSPGNAALVAEAVKLVRDMGGEVATCAEAARVLDLPQGRAA